MCILYDHSKGLSTLNWLTSSGVSGMNVSFVEWYSGTNVLAVVLYTGCEYTPLFIVYSNRTPGGTVIYDIYTVYALDTLYIYTIHSGVYCRHCICRGIQHDQPLENEINTGSAIQNGIIRFIIVRFTIENIGAQEFFHSGL